MDDEDYRIFSLALLRLARQHDVKIWAYCLMPNHWHIVLECADPMRMAAMFKSLLNQHTKRHHEKYQTIGHGPIYQGRYKSFAVEDEQALEAICKYVECNPIRAGMAERLGDWPWSTKWGKWGSGDSHVTDPGSGST